VRIHKLTTLQIDKAKPREKPYSLSDGSGLYLRVRPGPVKSWVFRFTRDGRPNEMGLGLANTVTLKQAREKAAEARKLIAAGRNPIEAKRQARMASAAKPRPTFGKCAAALIDGKKSEWRNAKHRRQWRVTLETYCTPIWAMPVDEVDTEAVLAVLQPLWQRVPETASRLRGRIEAVLDAAKARGWRFGENPARWRGHLDKLLPKRQKLSRGHFCAMPYGEVPAFMARLRERETMAGRALEFAILTASRSGEVLGLRWAEIDWVAKVWILPANRTKAAREHRVPLSGRALAILTRLAEARAGEFVFFGRRPDEPLSPASLIMTLRQMKAEGATVHGFRSAFRDWCGNETHFPRELAEAALAHRIGDATEAAYRRSDALEKRRALMEAWAQHCGMEATDNVVALRRAVLSGRLKI
jgi:integrase